jgi:uncharacterized protein
MVDTAPGKSCGSCGLCCKVLEIGELPKPAGIYCPHCAIGTGCGIYPERPDPCRNFLCAWLYNPSMGPELKPDVAHVMICEWVDRRLVVAICDDDHPDAWRAPAVVNFLRQTAASLPSGWLVIAKLGAQSWRITPNAILSEEGGVTGFVEPRVGPVWRAALM